MAQEGWQGQELQAEEHASRVKCFQQRLPMNSRLWRVASSTGRGEVGKRGCGILPVSGAAALEQQGLWAR